MLQSLLVKNFALIESLDLHFGPSLNIITGETGAGKSIIVDALMAVLGERTSAEMIRAGEQKAVIEGEFSITGHPTLPGILRDNDYESDNDTLLLRREISAKGGSRCFVNDSPAPLHIVKEIGNALVDFHGQHEHQSILDPSTHTSLLDNLGGLENMVASYHAKYDELRTRTENYHSILRREQELREKQEYQRFQYDEIRGIDPQPNEEQQLEREQSIIENSEKLFDSTMFVHHTLYGDDASVRDNLVKVRNTLERLRAFDPQFEDSAKEMDAVIVTVEEVAKFAQSYNSHLDFSPERLEHIRERSAQLLRLKKKYGSVERAIEMKNNLEQELQLIENFEGETARLRNEITALQQVIGTLAQRLSVKRKDIARKVEKSIVAQLKQLGITDATFAVTMEQTELPKQLFDVHEPLAMIGNQYYKALPNGIDTIHFFISTNKGEDVKPLERVVSGGEASRIMLSIKSILAKSDRLPMLVFDEIDTGISGRIAQKVGKAMKELAAYHQIIAITHQPQIAAMADTHISVSKSERKGRIVVNARVLRPDEQLREVAALLGGEEITDATLNSARELIEAAG
ncbi:MAG: DNA repair protein RecN [Candidatus Kapabacteria bacterium]|nr:DNA repair protein RecN [Candidatus Kapabacteria bacterium]